MNKRHNFLLCGALLAAGLTLAGCADDDAYSGSGSPTARPGEAIQFGVNKVATRTVYEEYDSTNNVYPIDWTDYDRIFISSTDAYPGASLGGKHNAVYSVVKPDRQDFPYHGEFYAIDPKTDGEVANSAFGLHWGSGENGEVFDKPYTFYGAYPAQRVKNYSDFTAADDVTDGTISMEYYTNQLCTVDRRFNDRYESTPDMLNAYMVARKTLPTPTRDHILLDFKPVMTTLDIYITAGGYEVATGIIQPVTVTGVSIITPGEVEGDELTFNTSQLQNEGSNEVTLQNFNPGSGSTESVFVGVKNDMVIKVDSGDTSDTVYQEPVRYIDLYEGETLHLMAFLPPFRDVADGTKIKVHALGGLNFVFKLKEGYNYFEAQKRIDVQLPDISPVLGNSNYMVNSWLPQLDANTPVMNLSIPGAECTKHEGDNAEKENAAELTKLLNMGVRALDMDAYAIRRKNSWGTNTDQLEFSDDVTTALEAFLDSTRNTNEFIIIWYHNASDNLRLYDYMEENFPGQWQSPENFEQLTIGNIADKRILVIKKNTFNGDGRPYFNPEDESPLWTLRRTDLFGWKNVNNIGDFEIQTGDDDGNKDNWKAWIIQKEGLNGAIYRKICSDEDSQKGFTGIVIIPKIEPLNYGEILIQSIIDCNFKFH